jgi:Leucine-rich repeat (LRR) protein
MNAYSTTNRIAVSAWAAAKRRDRSARGEAKAGLCGSNRNLGYRLPHAAPVAIAVLVAVFGSGCSSNDSSAKKSTPGASHRPRSVAQQRAKPRRGAREEESPSATNALPGSQVGARPIPRDIVQAWKKGGAGSGWMGVGSSGSLTFRISTSGMTDVMPGLTFPAWKEGVVPQLPDPGIPFALSLNGQKLTDAGLKELERFDDLKSLALYNTDLGDGQMKLLARLTSLEYLDISHTKVTDAGLRELSTLKRLRSLCLNDTEITDQGLEDLAAFTELKFLHLTRTMVTDEGVKHLAKLNALERLALNGAKVTGAGLGDLENLKLLNLNTTMANDTGLLEMARLKNLESLQLFNTEVTDKGFRGLAGLNRMQSLTIHNRDLTQGNRHITDAGISELAGLTDLRSLVLSRTQMSDAAAPMLAKMEKLQELDLAGSNIGDEGVRWIAQLEKLQKLRIGDTKVTDVCVPDILRLKNLVQLSISGKKFSYAARKKLEKMMPKCRITN